MNPEFRTRLAAIGTNTDSDMKGLPNTVGEMIQEAIVGRRSDSVFDLPFPSVEVDGETIRLLTTRGYTQEGRELFSPFNIDTKNCSSFYLEHPGEVWDRVFADSPTLKHLRNKIEDFELFRLFEKLHPKWVEMARIQPELYTNRRLVLGVISMIRTKTDYYGQDETSGLVYVSDAVTDNRIRRKLDGIAKILNRFDLVYWED